MGDESNPTTLYVGNLDHTVSEELLCALFSQIGQVKGCKVIREPGNDPYAFVDFTNHQGAATALAAMNKRVFLEKEMKVNWATSPGNQPKLDTSNHHHIFVGDLSPEIETQALRDAFAPFGEISNCRIVRDPQTLKSKGYAFVSFVKKAEAENAILAMNGQWLGSRSIRTNWSTRKPPPPRDSRGRQNNAKAPTFDEVYNQSSPTNCTVYCGGFINGINDELMQKVFSPFGTIQDIRCFKDKGYAFIKFTTKEAATHAIESVHNTEINGQIVKCFWGKESVDPNTTNLNNTANANHQVSGATAQWPYMYGNMGYWYPQSYTTPTAAAHMQQQYLQGMQYPGYGQFTNYAVAAAAVAGGQNYVNRMGAAAAAAAAAAGGGGGGGAGGGAMQQMAGTTTTPPGSSQNPAAAAAAANALANAWATSTNTPPALSTNSATAGQQMQQTSTMQPQTNMMAAYAMQQYHTQ
uniref:Putative apoptosis-promoting rna-binding protein tia-1/tiar rrm superfamily n=1 Tax=Triatoma infestans TaxID=30076 RepID=A0A023F4I9_TRIIF